MPVLMVYVTCSGAEEAGIIAAAAVNERLAACANIFPPHQSVYHWQGKVERGEEVAVIMKTRTDLFAALKARVVELHSYDTPCVVAWPVERGNAAFLQWVEDETK